MWTKAPISSDFLNNLILYQIAFNPGIRDNHSRE